MAKYIEINGKVSQHTSASILYDIMEEQDLFVPAHRDFGSLYRRVILP